MEIKCSPQELKELIENKKVTPVAGTTDVTIRLDKTILNDQLKYQLSGQQI